MPFLLFGCTGPEDGGTTTPPAVNQTGGNQSGGVSVIVEPQQNITVTGNATQEQPPEQPPETQEASYADEPGLPLTAYFIYVGDNGLRLQGDAILIKKGDLDILVDAGPVETSARVVDFLKSREVDDIDVLILTNGDPQHYGGVPLVAGYFGIEEFWWAGGTTFADQDYAAAVEAAASNATYVHEVGEGYSRTMNGIRLDVLNPPAERFSEVNNDAIVTKLTDRNFTMLLLSGVQTGAQGRLVTKHEKEITCDIMQAPYYGLGSGTSNIGIVLLKSEPEFIVISGGTDESAEAGGSRAPFIRYMDQYDIPWYANYVNGTIRVASDGQEYAVVGLD